MIKISEYVRMRIVKIKLHLDVMCVTWHNFVMLVNINKSWIKHINKIRVTVDIISVNILTRFYIQPFEKHSGKLLLLPWYCTQTHVQSRAKLHRKSSYNGRPPIETHIYRASFGQLLKLPDYCIRKLLENVYVMYYAGI